MFAGLGLESGLHRSAGLTLEHGYALLADGQHGFSLKQLKEIHPGLTFIRPVTPMLKRDLYSSVK